MKYKMINGLCSNRFICKNVNTNNCKIDTIVNTKEIKCDSFENNK